MPPGSIRTAQIASPFGNRQQKKETLHILASSSSTTAVDAARALLERGENVKCLDSDLLTPLHYACSCDNVEMAQLLLSFGADPMSADKYGRTAISMAKGNTLRFMRRYQKKDRRQKLGLFRKFFACHTRHDRTFFITRQGSRQSEISHNDSFDRKNPITKSYRNAKKKIRATINVIAGRQRASSEFEDIVMTSEGLRKIETPTRPMSQKRCVSSSEVRVPIPQKSDIDKEDKRRAMMDTPKRANATRRARSKTPDICLGGVAVKVNRKKRSKSQDNIVEATNRSQKYDPMGFYNSERAKAVGLTAPKPRVMPTAPPLTPSRSRSRERTAEINTTAYFTADEEEEFEKKMEQLEISPFVDDGEMRKIKRLNEVQLKRELKKFGISPAGQLDPKMRRLYEKRLLTERRKALDRGYDNEEEVMEKKYSQQLELVLKTGKLGNDYLKRARDVDEKVRQEFCGQEFGYTAFCYLIMDPRILGNDVDAITFRTFVDSIFYVGKGSKNRPLQHFIDARNERRKNLKPTEMKEKLKKINEIWNEGLAIPRHEIAHGISNEEAFVREGSIIEALRVKNLSNQKAGDFQGSTKKWDNITKAEYGTFLLHQALTTLKAEGIRTIREESLPDSLYPFVNNRRGGGTPKTPN